VGGWIHHLRRSRVARYVDRRDVQIHEGPALLRGVVEAGEDDPNEPVLTVEAPAPGASDTTWRSSGRSFLLRMPSGATLRVEPDEGRWFLDTTFVPTRREGGPAYVAEVRPGDVVYISGDVRRELDAREAGRGYRDAARAWVVRAGKRGGLRLCSSEIVASHLTRAGFHGRWAAGIAFALFAVTGWLALQVRQEPTFGALVLVPAVAAWVVYGYWSAAEDSAPWMTRQVPR